ncbi:twin-arginine translocation signal domain-containing protein, partial [Streptomyces sp. NPDC051098]|uniref:twin-arginine translocation signal domain-containing protein n=1 Tax=Streptomyces sp. NPDC051098 TaxID=3155411 RepID=UPI003438A188
MFELSRRTVLGTAGVLGAGAALAGQAPAAAAPADWDSAAADLLLQAVDDRLQDQDSTPPG